MFFGDGEGCSSALVDAAVQIGVMLCAKGGGGSGGAGVVVVVGLSVGLILRGL